MLYYQALELIQPKLSLDLDELQRRFYSRSRQLHPDRFARASSAEQQAALEASSVLNDAYRTLRDPVLRAEYFLKHHGFDIGEQRSKDVPPDLLEEVFDLNMALEELKMGDDSVQEQIDHARGRFEHLRQGIDQELEELFGRYDRQPEQGLLVGIRGLLNRRRYVTNLIQTASTVAPQTTAPQAETT